LNPPREQRGNLSVRLLAVLGLLLLFIVVLAYFFYGLQPIDLKGHPAAGTSGIEKAAQFKIEKGEGVKSVGAHLSREAFIRSVGVFKAYMLLTGRAQRIQPGVYELSTAMSVPQIVELFTTGGKNEVSVTIPEGSTVKDIRQFLIEAGVWKEDVPLEFPMKELVRDYPFLADAASFEGFMFPDTYRIALDATPEGIARVFLDNFQLKAWPLLQGTKDWYASLMLASLLEREVPDFSDRQIVAGILLKRLRIRMPLQVDATISYAKCEGQLRYCEVLRVLRNDVSFSSPYNTYQRLGWPPTPISNPGQAAIKAALTPKDTPYLYYLSSKSGETYFSKTLEEHNDKRVIYL